MMNTDILSIISAAKITGSDFEMWQKVIAFVPKEALSDIRRLFSEHPESVKVFSKTLRDKITAVTKNNKNLIDSALKEENSFISSII